MTPAAELAIARRAAAHVARALELSGLTLARRGRERTSAAAIDRLTAHLAAPLPADTTAARRHRDARAELRAAEALWWELAASAEAVAIREARRCGPPLPLEDRIQEARVGVYRAARIFDAARKLRFATHARWWARAQVTRATEQAGRPIRLSTMASELVRYARRIEGTVNEQAAVLGCDAGLLAAAQSALCVASLDAPVLFDDGDETSLGSLLAAPVEDGDGGIDSASRWAAVARALERLPARERAVLERRYGLGREPEPLTAIGAALGVSRERTRQIEADALVDLARLVRAGRAGRALVLPERESTPPATPRSRPYGALGRALTALVEREPGILASDAAERLGVSRILHLPLAVRAESARRGVERRLWPVGGGR